jgi:ABC-type multidrug transport system fused ATPase/permease subunit
MATERVDARGIDAAAQVHPSPDAAALLLQGVSYHYPHSQKVALDDVSYTFGTGATAIVGPNGAGKSTFVKLVTGLLAPTSGAIRARMADGGCLPPESAAKGVLFQEPAHLYLTVRQNVTMRYERAPDEDERIHHALELAGLGAVVAGLPDGLDTLIGAGFGGRVDLSGGQWQRLALARLIYQDAPIMILDEPVASLDPEGERAVFELFAELRHRIIIFTTHRYDSIPPGTPIVVLVDGRVSESGTHEELLRRQRDYWSLYTSGSSVSRGGTGRHSRPDGARPPSQSQLDGGRPGRHSQPDGARPGRHSQPDGARPGTAKQRPTWEGAVPPRAGSPPRQGIAPVGDLATRVTGERRVTWRSSDVR